MKISFFTIGSFILGCLLGYAGLIPDGVNLTRITLYVLFVLIVQVGINIGSDSRMAAMIRTMSPKLLLVPLATVVGTFSLSAIAAALFIHRWGIWDCLAASSGFAYYSLSSIMIAEMKEPELGAALAAELGTVALLANVLREVITIGGAPLLKKWFGIYAPICAGGATTMDSTLPSISMACGQGVVFISILHGFLMDLSVPFFVTLFCSL